MKEVRKVNHESLVKGWLLLRIPRELTSFALMVVNVKEKRLIPREKVK